MMKSSSKNSGNPNLAGNSNMAPPETETTVVMRRSKSGGKINFEKRFRKINVNREKMFVKDIIWLLFTLK